MKHKFWLALVMVLILVVTGSSVYANKGDYSLDWWTVDGGGGTSGNAQYTLSGVAGQPDAGIMTSPGYTLAGGFWVGPAYSAGAVFLPLIIK